MKTRKLKPFERQTFSIVTESVNVGILLDVFGKYRLVQDDGTQTASMVIGYGTITQPLTLKGVRYTHLLNTGLSDLYLSWET